MRTFKKYLSLALAVILIIPTIGKQNVNAQTTAVPEIQLSIEDVEGTKTINLTEEGNLDWRQSYPQTQLSIQYDAKKQQEVGKASPIELDEIKGEGSAPIEGQTDAKFITSYIDAAGGGEATNLTRSRSIPGNNGQFIVTVPCESGVERTLKIYLGVWNDKIGLTGKIIQDGTEDINSNPPSMTSPQAISYDVSEAIDLGSIDTGSQANGTPSKPKVITVKYRGETGQKFVLTGTSNGYNNNKWSNFAISAITLSGVIPVKTIEINQDSIEIPLQGEVDFEYNVLPKEANTEGIQVEIADSSIATYDSTTGKIKGLVEGTTTIEVKDASGIRSNQVVLTVKEQVTPNNVNLALNKIATAHHTNGSDTPQKAIDGDSNTRWDSNSGSEGHITVDLGQIYRINQVEIEWEARFSSNYEVQVSVDGQSYTTVATVTGKENFKKEVHKFNETRAKFVKVVGKKGSNNGMSIFEIGVYNKLLVPEDNQITNIALNTGTIMPTFNRDNKYYEVNVGEETNEVILEVSTGQEVDILINDRVVKSNSGFTLPLEVGENVFIIKSVDPNEQSIFDEYVLNINRLNYVLGSMAYKNVVQDARTQGTLSVHALDGAGNVISTNQWWSPIENLTDGNRYNIAQPNLSANTPWGVQLDLGSKYITNNVTIVGNQGNYLNKYSISISEDGISWTEIAKEETGLGQTKVYRFSSTAMRYVKIQGTESVGYSSIREVEIYGTEVSMESIVNTLKEIEISRGDTQLNIPNLDGYTVTIYSTSNSEIIDMNGTISPVKNIELKAGLKFTVTNNNTGEERISEVINLTVPALVDIVSILPLEKVEVTQNTQLDVAKTQLAGAVEVKLTDGTMDKLDVVWSSNTIPAYVSNAEGEYQFSGNVSLKQGITNDKGLDLTVKQIVQVMPVNITTLRVSPQSGAATILDVPFTGKTRRRFLAWADGATLDQYQDNTYKNVIWEIEGIEGHENHIRLLEDGMLEISPDPSYTEEMVGNQINFTIIARDKMNNEIQASTTGIINYTPNNESAPQVIGAETWLPGNKDDWQLYYNDEFNGFDIDRTAWSDYYLRQWAIEGDDQAHTQYRMEDGTVGIYIDVDTKPWSPLDGAVKSSGMMSFERTALHRFGNNAYENGRDIPTFDGPATTKYGYFELRAKHPNMTDGSHNAWWMVGIQEDQNALDTGKTYVSNQVMEIDIDETTSAEKLGNRVQSVYHTWGSDPSSVETVYGSNTNSVGGNANIDNEFHNYGFEWGPDYMKWYVDGRLIKQTNAKIDHRLVTLIGVYANSWGGSDQGVYPKEYTIDYFRIYKRKDSAGKPSEIIFDETTLPQKVYLPEQGMSKKIKIAASVYDRFHQKETVVDGVSYNVPQELHWYLTTAANKPFKTEDLIPGISIDHTTGEVTVTEDAIPGTKFRVCAKPLAQKDVWGIENRVRQSFTIIVDAQKQADRPTSVFFKDDENVHYIDIPSDNTTYQETFTAKLYNQYLEVIEGAMPIEYSLVKDTPGDTKVAPQGVTLNSETGELIIDHTAQEGTVFYIHARQSGVSNRGNETQQYLANNYIIKLR